MKPTLVMIIAMAMVVLCISAQCKPIEQDEDTSTMIDSDKSLEISRRGKRSGIIDQRLNDMSLIHRFKQFQRKLAKMKEMQNVAHNFNNTPAKWTYFTRKNNLLRPRRDTESTGQEHEMYHPQDVQLEKIVDFLVRRLQREQYHRDNLNGFMGPDPRYKRRRVGRNHALYQHLLTKFEHNTPSSADTTQSEEEDK